METALEITTEQVCKIIGGALLGVATVAIGVVSYKLGYKKGSEIDDYYDDDFDDFEEFEED
ncbi:MAG: hypothetical protein IKR19_07975 [Acholeplasmatales bacterium]|nr:hypothetical protein [Acholeplasmatales bacterium]